MDKGRLNNEDVPQITQGDIDAWNRGKGDGARNKLLAASRTLSVEKAVALVKMYAELGDVHYLSTRFDISVSEANKVLAAFGIQSIEDAKAAVRSGVISEYDAALKESLEDDVVRREVEHEAASERLEEQERAQEPTELTEEEQDIALAERRDKAQEQNKKDKLRQLIAEGLELDANASSFRIPMNRISEFKQLIPHGVGQLQRRFGGKAKDIVSEIKRLAPDVDVDMLRR